MEQILGTNNSIQDGEGIQHVFIVGAKCLGAYGGYETFVNKLIEYHETNQHIRYHVVCKANGDGCGDENLLPGVVHTSPNEFEIHGAHCVKLPVPEVGPAQAIIYDCKAVRWCIDYIREHEIRHPIVYILACRIGPFMHRYAQQIHTLGGHVYLNPDGHEWMRSKWPLPVRRYWRISEQMMVREADLVICDSINIEKYIHEQYDGKGVHGNSPRTTYIAYGADITPSTLSDDAPRLTDWYRAHGLQAGRYYLVVGRFVPENSYEVIIREFMHSHTQRDLVIITGSNDRFLHQLERRLHFSQDPRIKFVGTVYDQELLKKIRENAYAYFHGHTVGGTNPSLIESLGSTRLNLLVDVGFNREVAEDGALYWSREPGDLSRLIDYSDTMKTGDVNALGRKARECVARKYTWDIICNEYAYVFAADDANDV